VLQHAHTTSVPRRVVIIGANGFVGRAVARRLSAARIPWTGLGRSEIDLQSGDAAERLAARLQPGDAVVAAAARVPCKNSAVLVDNMVIANVMLHAFARVAVSHVVNVSSDAVYADEWVPLTESSPAAPNTMHGAMHLAREIALRAELKAPLAILRPTSLYGSDDPHNSYGPNQFRRLAVEGKDIVLFGAGEERRDHVFIEDLAELILRILSRRSTGILNVATGEVHSFRAIAEMVIEAAANKVGIRQTARTGRMPHNGYRPFDPAACRVAFPDFTYMSLQEGIRRVQEQMNGGAGG
jgi:nucleoside-diphosphate-sugar epimerase